MAVTLVYFTALAVSVAFFLWCAGTYIVSSRGGRQAPAPPPALAVELSDAAIFALYCQYLVAPLTATREAQRALGITAEAGPPLDNADFLTLLEQLEQHSAIAR